MSTSISRLSFQDCFDLLERASDKNLRVKFADYNTAFHFRLRLHRARVIDRYDNRSNFEEGHQLHGRSIYDPIVATIEKDDDCFWLYLKKLSLDNMVIEDLEEA